MGKKNTERKDSARGGGHPYWWCHHQTHPAWCKGGHEDGDHGSDRDCLSDWERMVGLTLPDAARIRRKANGPFAFDVHPSKLVLFLHQRYRECAPRIVLSPDRTNEGTRYDLTRDEAEALGRALLEGVLLIDGNPVRD